MNTGSEAGHIQPTDDTQWTATVSSFRDYLAGCRAWLEQYNRTSPILQAVEAKAKSGLPRDAASHRSEHVYLLPAGASRECVTFPYPTVTSYRPALWITLGDDSTPRKRKAA